MAVVASPDEVRTITVAASLPIFARPHTVRRIVLCITAAALPAVQGASMPRMFRVSSGADGPSHIAEEPLALAPLLDTEGAHGETPPPQAAQSIAFRVAQPGYA